MRNFAVCLLLSTALLAQKPLDDRIADALDRSRPALIKFLRETDEGVLSLVCLAAVHDGMGSRDKEFVRALERLAKSELTGTYGISIRLMVLAQYQDFPDREEIAARDARELVKRQTEAGGFSYHMSANNWDLSNTQYAALGLRAAASMQLDVPERTWQKLMQAVVGLQKKNGGFCYVPLRSTQIATPSMTVAGIAVLELCLQHLDLKKKEESGVIAAIDRAWQWMADNKRSIGKREQRACLYYHYGLERAAVLSDVADVDGVDWYATGAEMVLRQQRNSGGFLSQKDMRPAFSNERARGNPVDTAFAILFLRRSFQRSLQAPITPGPGYFCLTLPAEATDEEIDRAARNDMGRGVKALPDLLECMRGNLLVRRKAAAMALFKITGQDFGYHPYRSAEENSAALRAVELWWLKNRKR